MALMFSICLISFFSCLCYTQDLQLTTPSRCLENSCERQRRLNCSFLKLFCLSSEKESGLSPASNMRSYKLRKLYEKKPTRSHDCMVLVMSANLLAPASGNAALDAKSNCIDHLSLQTTNKIAKMRQKGQLTDVTLKLDGGAMFQAHKAVLSGRSPYFRALFTGGFRESKQTTICLPEIKVALMSQILDYVYTASVSLGDSNVQELMTLADALCLQELVDKCAFYMAQQLCAENCIEVRHFASWYAFSWLYHTAHKFLCRNFIELMGRFDRRMLDMPVQEFMILLQDDELIVADELDVWQALVKWVDHDPTQRRRLLPPLLRHVRFGLIERPLLLEEIKAHPYVRYNADCCGWQFKNACRSRADQLFGPHPCTECHNAVPRMPHSIILAIGGWSTSNPTDTIESYDNRANRWLRVNQADQMGERAYHGCVVLGSCVYVIGGFDGREYFNSVRCFNPITGHWTEKAPMNCRRCYVSVVVLNAKIYALGGFDGVNRLNSVERYDPSNNQWTLDSNMNEQRSDAHAAVVDGRIYICGGFDGKICLASAEVYDPVAKQWTKLPMMTIPRSGVGVVECDGQLYAFGGFDGSVRLKTAERLIIDGGTIKWRAIASMATCRSNFAVEVLDGNIYVMGGFDGSGTVGTVEAYEPEKNRWRTVSAMSVVRSALYACVLHRVSDMSNSAHFVNRDRIRLAEEACMERRRARAAKAEQKSIPSIVGHGIQRRHIV